MPDNNKTPVRSFKIDGQVFDIPESKVNDFLNDAPEAEEIRSYTVGKDTFDIPVPQVEEFLTDAPEAKPVQQYPEQQENTADYGPFDKETVEKYPQARQNFERWQKGQTTARQDSVEPTIDPNAVNFKDENFKKPTPETKDDDLTGFWQEIGKRGHRSAIELNKMLANAPDFVNRIAVQAFNASPPGQAIQGIGEIVGQNWKMEAKDLRPEQFNEYSEKQKEQLTKKIAEINPKHEQGIIESAKKGDWITFTRNLAGGVADSFAPSLAMMISGAGMAAPGMISSGAAVFGAGKYDEMDKAAPNMTEDAKVMAAAANGAFEGIFETYLGSGAVGKAFRKIIEQEGKQAAKGVVQRGLSKGFSDLLSKYPALAPLGEGFEEMGTQVAQNVVDKYSGYRPDISITEGVADAGAIGMAAGASHSAPLYATKKVVDGIAGTPQQPTGPNQPQAPVDPEGQAPTVNPEQQLNALREQYRQEAAGKLDEFKHKTGNIVTGVDHKGNTYFVKDGDRADEDGMLIVYDENGKKEQIHENNISDWVTTDYESALEAQMQAFDQQVEQRLRPQVNDKVNYQGQPHIILEDNGDSYTLADMQGNPVDNVPKQTIIQENQAQQPAEATEGQQPGVQPQEQPQPKPVVTETIGGNKYGFTENEDGSLDLVIPENAEPQKLLTQLEKEFKDNPDWEVRAEKEVVEVPPESRFQRPTQREIIRNIQVAPKNNQNITGQTSQENKTSEINPELKQQVEAETQPSYQYRGQEIDRETAQGLIEVAAMQENPEKLNDLVVNNDEQLTTLMQESFPEKKPSYKLGNRNLTPAQVKAAILAAETPEELSRVKIQNDNQFDELLQQKQEEFNHVAQKEQEQRNREHDYLVSKLRTHNNLTEGMRQRANTSQIVQKAAQLGYTVKPGNKGKFIVTNENGSEIQYTPDRTSSQKKNQHPTLQEYDNDFQQKVETILSPAALTGVQLGDLRPAEVKQGVIDIQAGKKTVPANRLLDELQKAYESGVVEWKGDRMSGERGPQMSFDEFVNFWQESELNEQEQAAAEQIPEETADAILDDEGELTPEMRHELYNQYVNLEQNEQETGSVQETETSETATEQTEGETGTESAEIIENDSKQEEKLTETESQQPEQQTSEEISEAESLQNREEISETGEERLQNWWEEYDVVNEITDFSGQKQQGEWIKIANAYFPLSEVQKYNSKDELLAAKLKEGETQQQSTDVQENLTTEQEGVKETELTPEETEIYNQAKTVVDNSLKNTTPEEMQKAKTGSGFAAAKFAMRYTSPEKNQRLYNAIYNLYFDAVKNYPTEQVSGNLTNETTKAEQPENRGKEATKKTFKLPIEKNLEQAEERVEKKKQDNEAIKSATKTPRTVRELADLEAEKQQGLISGVVLSALKEGDTFKVGRNKTYTVTRKTKPKKVEYSREKHSGQYDRTTVTITDNEGKKYTYELWDNWIQDGNKMVSTIHRKGATPKSDMVGQLSMDIEGDINLDLINENNRLHEKTDSYKIIEKELNRINKEQPEVDEEVGNKTPEQKPETPENQSEPQQEVGSNVGINEYKYHLRSRPFSIGTYPQNDNFVRHEEDNTPFGKVIYSEPLSIEDVKKFELVPEGQVEAGDYVMSLGNNEYPVRVEVVKNQKGQDAVKLTNEENGFNQNMSAVDFMEQLQEGKFIKAPQNKPESKFLDDKVEQAGKKKPKRKSFTQQVKKGLNEKEIDRLDELRNKLRNKLGGQLNAGLDPETFMMAAEATGLVIKSGMRQFSDYASSMVDLLGNKIKPHLKALYEYTKRADSAEFIDKMTPTNEVDNADIDEILQQPDESNVNLDNENNQQDVSDRTGNSEQDSGRNADDVRPDQNDVPSDRGRSGNTGTSNQGTGRTGNQKQEGSQGRIDLFTPTDGERSDSGISEKDEGLQSETENAGNTDTERGSDNRTEGNNDERTGNHSDRGSNQKDNKSTKSFAERVKENLKKQKAAENVPVKPTNRENISETLPFLLEEQQDDVYKAEKRYYNPDQKTHEKAYGKGMLFTNGTGTGKTYTGLGVIKRFIKQGKNRILIVVPSQPKVSDWIEDAKNLNINVNGLKDTQDKGEGVVITTYANMRANMKLMEEDFDLVVYDESHRLMEDKNGNPSSTTYAHYNISNKSKDQALARLKMVHPLWKKELDLEKQIRREGERRANPDLMEEMYQESLAKEKELEAELKEVNEQQKKVLPDLEKRAQKAYENTKVLFLSATPFKMHFNLRYANGYLYDWGEEITYESASRGQSRVDAESRFFLDNFGSAYEWKYHRLQKKSDANPQAVAMQEAEFAEKLMKSGAMSGRAIESEQDYSREFPLVALDKSELINRAYSDIYNYSTKEFSELTTAAGEVFHNYNYTTKLFESLKTSMVLPRVKEHIKLGRKVVLFHRRRQSGVAPPFQTVLNTTRINAKFVLNDPDSNQKSKDQAEEALRQADAFEEKYGELLEYEQNLNYNSAIDQVVEEFGVDRVRFINGTVSKKDKNKAVIDFNNDNSGVDIIVVQEEAGKEGISLHDTTGKHQRVEISLSMPISSITALQMEGRIYRIGQETDAIFEYPLLGLDLEVAYFGQNINRRLSTTENLAVGNQSRDLIRSFAEGVLFNSSADSPNVEQGKGGKEYDKKEVELQSEFQRARLVYQTNQKQRGRRDQRKGIDYYPTPEPVGQKMVEWLGLESGETGLEPSAGHGAIAMWFPDRAKVTAIEPAYGLYSKLTARVGGAEPKVINDTFENHHVVNKYDGIAMNPPFGQGGKTAMDHIEKAFSHLREGGRIVAIVPNGGSMQKRLDKFFAAENDKGKLVNPDAVLKAEIEMPGVMFDQAGTKINSKIIVIDKVPIKSERQIRDEVRRESNQRALDGGALMTLEEISQEVDRRMRAQIANREWTYPSHDFKDIENINELFDVIEDLELPERTKPEGSSQPQAGPAVTEQNTDKPKYEIFEQKHSQTGEDLFMAMPTEYLGKDTFRELKQLAKKHDGYYSSYQNKANNVKRGFTFKSEESRNKFVAEAQKDDTGIRLRVSEPLYSPTERALERIKQEKGTPEQFKSMLLKNGAKQAELDWMGFDEFSQDKKSLTKQEIQEWIDGNKVEIKEVEKSVPEEQTSTAEFTPEAEERYEELKLIRDKWEFANEIADYNKEELTPTQKRNINEWEEEFESWDNLVDNIIPDFESNNENYKTDTGDTKYSQYQLPGGPLSRDTEILTQFGWVRMDKIQKGDIVLSRKDEGGVLEWVPVEDVPTVYSEKLYHFKSQSVDMMVTPNHQMVVEKRVGDKNHRRRIIQRMTASDLWNTWDCRIPLMGEWEGKHVEEIFGLPAGDVMEFMGWYISEGWAKICRKTGNKSTIGIGQSREKNPKKSQRIEQLLNRLGFSWSYSANGMQYYVGVKSVPQQLRKMCYSLGKAEEKFIPNELFQYSKPLLKRLHESMILGDGHIAICKKGIRKNKANYFTISKKLADDFQILTLQIGLRGKILIRKSNEVQKNDLYCVAVNTKPYATVDDAKHAIVNYNDIAYCVTVKNHAIYVRRNGTAAWTGNSNYREIVMTMPATYDVNPFTGEKSTFAKSDKNYKSSHWEEANPIAHVRIKDYTDTEQRKLLHAEEIQADKGQEWLKLKRKINAGTATKEDIARFEFLDNNFPFNKTTEWLNLALRRLAVYAAENGYQGISWTPGEQQAERYDLSKQVESITATPTENGKFVFIDMISNHNATLNVDSDGKIIEDKNNLPGDQSFMGKNLDDIVGKDISEKILKVNEETKLEGEDLKVGGEGQVVFYDKIIPAQANKIFKKFGAKVQTTTINLNEGDMNLEQANDAVMNLPEDGKLDVMYLPVTDKLKKVATEQGMPLFKDTESQFITDRIHNNKLKALFQKYFESAKNTGTIHVVTSPQEVPAEFRQKQTLKGTQGFYDVNTGETYFITGNIQDPAEAFKTWVHEVGVHRGLSNIIPPAELNSFFQKIYDDIGSEEIKANIPESYHELDPTEQAEEYLAFLGEKVVNEKDLTPREKGVWQRIIDTVKNILNKLFTGARYTTKDAENVVKAAVQSVYQPPTGPKGSSANQTRDIRYRKTSDKVEDAQSAILNSDGFINDNIEALRAATEAYNEQAPGKVPLKKSLEQMREFWIDQNMPIRRWEEEIKKRGGKQDDNSKPYRDIRNMFGRMEALYRKFQDQKMNPIKDSIVKLVDSGIDSKSILPYIIAKHGLERNRVMRQNRLDEWKLNYEAKNGEKPSQEMTEAQAAKLEGQDFSGLKPFDTNDKFDNVDDLARSIVDGFEQQAEDKLLNEFWDNIRSATSYTLETWKEGGQISEKEYEKLKKQYKHFVPLRGWREDAAKFLNYKDNEGGIGKSLKRALGRKSLADNPFAYIQSVAFKAINEQVTNEIKQSAFRLVFNNYGGDFKDLHQIKRAYLVRKEIWNEETEQNEEAWVLYRDENGNLARPPKEMFDEGDVKIEFNNDHEKLRTIWNAKQHEVVVRNNGGFSVMIFPDSQLSVAQSLNNQNTMANFLGHSFDARKLGETWLFRGLGSVTNFMKGMMTSYNPVFPATNFFRDQPEAALTQFIRGNARVADFPTKYTPIAAKAIIENIAGKNKNGKYVEELRNFYEAGGTTGFTHEKRVEQLEKELKKEIDRALRASTTKGKTIDKLTHILDYIEHWNRIFEDTTRFAVYLSARDKGMTVRDAAFQSRTASVDFNMKGKGTRVVESFFAFFKAGINALQKNAKLGKDHPKRFAATAAGVATLGLLEALVNDWIDDDDEYYRLNDYVRQNYFVLQKWWGDENEYLRIPLPQFWRGFHALGVSVYDYAKGKSTLGEAIGQTVSNMIAGMAPIDVTGFIHEGKFSSDPLWPTSIKPIREIVVNRNFMGSQIAMEPFTKSLEEDLSDSGLHKRNVNPLIKFVTDMMFKAAGGEGKLKFKMTEDGELKYVVDALDVNPSKIEHFINGYLGGTSKFLNDFVTTLWQFGDTEEEFDINNAPFLNSFIRNVPEEKWGILREYQAFEDAIQDADKYRSTAQSDMNAEGMKKFYRSDYAEAKAVYDIYDSAISDIMEAYGFDSEEAAKEVTDLMKEAIDKFEQLNIKEK